MVITINDIQDLFDDLETETKSREEIAEIAALAMKADDQGGLKIEPSSDFGRIWEALKYLSGVDLREEPDTYLHCQQDFTAFKEKIGISKTS